jgi:deazaflavin-dependent oxidoreductase (nitroreductase family)
MNGPVPHGEPIPPSALVRIVMRPMVTVLNPIIRTLAGRRFMNMAALLSHRGRRSGRRYTTPVGAHVRGGDCLVPLTFGSGSDWSKNLQATGRGHLRWKGKEFEVSAPRVLLAADVMPLVKRLFSLPSRLGFKVLGIKGFLYLRAVPVESDPQRAR